MKTQVKRVGWGVWGLLSIVLVGVTLWSGIDFWRTGFNWTNGRSMIQGIIYTIYCAPIGAIGTWILLSQVRVITVASNKRLSLRGLVRGVQIGVVIVAVVATGLCVPYYTIPTQIGHEAKHQFGMVFGSDWEARLTRPSQGPWLRAPFSASVQAFGLPYTPEDLTFTSNIEFYHNGVDSFKCDIYSPNRPGPFPVLIYIHGGKIS